MASSARMARRIGGLLPAILLAACSVRTKVPESSKSGGMEASVDSASDRLLAALRADSPDSLVALLADNVVIMPPNQPALRGKAAIRTWYEGLVAQFRTSSLTISDREVRIGGDWATEVASFEWTLAPVGGGAPVVDKGSYIQLWHRHDGRWRFSREIWNSSVTP